MSEICKKHMKNRGSIENTSFDIEEFLTDRFSGTHPHTSLKEKINKLSENRFIIKDKQDIKLSEKGIDYCRKKTIGFV